MARRIPARFADVEADAVVGIVALSPTVVTAPGIRQRGRGTSKGSKPVNEDENAAHRYARPHSSCVCLRRECPGFRRQLRGWAFICTRSVRALPCIYCRAGFPANDHCRAGFPVHCQHIGNDCHCAPHLFADIAPEDAQSHPIAGAIGQCDRLRAQSPRAITRRKTLNHLCCRSSTRSRPAQP